MKIGVLLCGHPAEEIKKEFGDYDAFFARLLDGQGLDLVSYDVENMEFPGSATECDGWLISGSKHGVYEDHAFIPKLEQLIRDAHGASVPIVGICFGHQIIATALGGRVEKYDGGWSVGYAEYTETDGSTLALNAWHQDQIVSPPKGAVTTASSDFCEHAALVYPNGIWSLQAHPEFDNDVIRVFLKVRGIPAGVPRDQLETVLSAPVKPINNFDIARRMAEHFKKHAKVEHV